MIVVVDYGMGNLASILNMLKKIGAEAAVSSDPVVIGRAAKLILPGVGAFDNGMRNLDARGLTPVLESKARVEKTPILGICLGMQLFSRSSEEGTLPGLGWVEAETRRFRFAPPAAPLKIPHMGWNVAALARPDTLFENLTAEARFYFVHSYHLVCRDPAEVVSWTTYGYAFASAVRKDNIQGVQFHPEKSLRFGMRLLENFWRQA